MPKPLQIFKLAYNTVPAYKEFLAKNHIDGSRVRNMADFQRLPIMSKENYLRAYKYEQLFPNGRIEKATTIAATSGSGGDPFYLPRGEKQDEQYEKIARGFLEKQFDFPNKVKSYLEAKDIEILSSISERKKELIAKIRIDTIFGKQTYFLIAKDKKKIIESDLTIALQKAREERSIALIMAPGQLDKKAQLYLKDWQNLLKFEKINI